MKIALNQVFLFVQIPDETVGTSSFNIEIITANLKNVFEYLYGAILLGEFWHQVFCSTFKVTRFFQAKFYFDKIPFMR